MPEKTSTSADLVRPNSPRAKSGARRISSVATMGALLGVTGSLMASCVSDPDCGVCDPDKLILEIMSGDNYSNDQIFLLSPECEGDKCPEPKKKGKYFVNQVLPCIEEEAAEDDARSPEEYCKISPLITLGGLEFVFNNLLEPTSIELVRKRPDDPSLFEVYDWKSRLARIEGPITRFNGDYLRGSDNRPDTMARAVNLTCVENLDFGGTPPNEALPDACIAVDWGADGGPRPLKMERSTSGGEAPLTKARVGATDWKAFSCSTPDEGPDTCCTVCDYELSVNVAKYGVSAPWNPDGNKSPVELKQEFNDAKVDFSGAIACTSDGSGNKYVECRDFIPGVFREDEDFSYTYVWDTNEPQVFDVPRYDKLRETHPDDRPAGIEQLNIGCSVDQDCPSGAACMGTDSMGNTCEAGAPDCTTDLFCRQEWFVDCVADAATTGAQGYCVDSRFKDAGAGACYTLDNGETVTTSTGQTVMASAGAKLSLCDTNENGFLNADECCFDAADPATAECDPIYSQLGRITPIDRFERDQTLPSENRDCFCGPLGGQRESCAAQVEKFCAPPHGTGPLDEGEYVTRFVSRLGGVVYDPALKGVNFLPADLGNYQRARVERCAEGATPQPTIDQRSILDGWRAGDSGRTIETNEDFDRAMCSGSEYKVVFETQKGEQRIEDKVGNTLTGKDTYVFTTPEFHVVPNSGFPTDNIRIGGCDVFELSLSNKFDLEPKNLNKIEIWEVQRTTGNGCDVPNDQFTSDSRCWENKKRVAGGEGCTTDDPAAVNAGTAVPCLTVDVGAQFAGTVRASIDNVIFGRQLFPAGVEGSTGRYRMIVPGLNSYDANRNIVQEFSSLADLRDRVGDNAERNAIYEGAFHDACGMPLVTAGVEPDQEPDFYYDFTVDEPKCIEDEDFDGVQVSCDNAKDYANAGQDDADADGFGDVWDTCAVTPTSGNSDDADRDGVGTACDTCRRATDFYNVADLAGLPVADLQVRNNPRQDDSDGDGIGDACDNCTTVPNCQSFGNNTTPWTVNTPIEDDNNNVCQTDNDMDMVGDTCAGQTPGADAAGPIGTDMMDDFDQDGLANVDDFCPRFPVEFQACTDDTDCGEFSDCDGGLCNHVDTDGDEVGDVCDTCPSAPNMNQVLFGGADMDDPDGDFIGSVCEPSNACQSVPGPRPQGFYEVSANGYCCVPSYPGDGRWENRMINGEMQVVCVSPPAINAIGTEDVVNGIMCDPRGIPIQRDCMNEPEDLDNFEPGTSCRQLPQEVTNAYGVLDLPTGCAEALTAAGMNPDNAQAENLPLTLTSPGVTDEVDLWSKMCFLPPWDQDFDGVGDSCDLCTFAFDPSNGVFIDEDTGQVFPRAGAACNGEFKIEESPKCLQSGGGGDAGTGTGGTGGMMTGTSG